MSAPQLGTHPHRQLVAILQLRSFVREMRQNLPMAEIDQGHLRLRYQSNRRNILDQISNLNNTAEERERNKIKIEELYDQVLFYDILIDVVDQVTFHIEAFRERVLLSVIICCDRWVDEIVDRASTIADQTNVMLCLGRGLRKVRVAVTHVDSLVGSDIWGEILARYPWIPDTIEDCDNLTGGEGE
ncbi:hypothetical protein ABW19_dt0203899 [Dactylella cylindrospora]|nr:hypothetical protein ABW19_dt0203899 [Dactylella cylindrospora]